MGGSKDRIAGKRLPEAGLRERPRPNPFEVAVEYCNGFHYISDIVKIQAFINRV